MSALQSTRPTLPGKPAKPYPEFPLFPHATRRWAKKIRGRLVYFGPWDDPDAALSKYLSERDDLHAGRTPRAAADVLTVGDLAGRFLTTKERQLDANELSSLMFAEYADACRRAVAAFGKRRLVGDLRPDDFERLRASMAKRWGPHRLGKFVNLIRALFNYGYKNALSDRPVVFGDGFRKPSRRTLLLHKHASGPRTFEAAEIRTMLAAAGPGLRAMMLLGINAGFGNADVGRLPMTAVDLAGGWVNYPRGKTGTARRCPLWPETVAAINAWLAVRPDPADPADAGLVFLTSKGGRWAKPTTDNPVSAETRKLLDRVGINGHRNFYSLRHTFQTIGDECGDFIAVRTVMGHGFGGDISATYREKVSDARLRKVAESVRTWLFGDAA
jgi:integrase